MIDPVLTFVQSPYSFNPEEVQRLLQQSYWAAQRPLELIAKSLENSLCFGFLDKDGKLVVFARVVTDKAVFGYLCDVIVDEPYRGKGMGKQLMEKIMQHPDLQNLRHFSLSTRDAHSLYSRYGFGPLPDPARWMDKFQDR